MHLFGLEAYAASALPLGVYGAGPGAPRATPPGRHRSWCQPKSCSSRARWPTTGSRQRCGRRSPAPTWRLGTGKGREPASRRRIASEGNSRRRRSSSIDWIATVREALDTGLGVDDGSQLSPAELRLLHLLPSHLSFPEIAEQLVVSPNTVKTQSRSIYRKFGVGSANRSCGLRQTGRPAGPGGRLASSDGHDIALRAGSRRAAPPRTAPAPASPRRSSRARFARASARRSPRARRTPRALALAWSRRARAQPRPDRPVDQALARGLRAVGLSLLVLGVTAVAQTLIYVVSGSVALLADLIHNFGDAATAIPLAIAFALRSARAERGAGLFVVFAIFFSGCVAGYEAIDRLINPETPDHLVALAAGAHRLHRQLDRRGSRPRAGRRLDSPALIADGTTHAPTPTSASPSSRRPPRSPPGCDRRPADRPRDHPRDPADHLGLMAHDPRARPHSLTCRSCAGHSSSRCPRRPLGALVCGRSRSSAGTSSARRSTRSPAARARASLPPDSRQRPDAGDRRRRALRRDDRDPRAGDQPDRLDPCPRPARGDRSARPRRRDGLTARASTLGRWLVAGSGSPGARGSPPAR